jgi:NADPH:quinone reductase
MTTIVRMKAPGGADQLEPATIALAPPLADEIRIRQTAIGVNFIDIYQRLGLYPLPPAGVPGVEGAPPSAPTPRSEIFRPGAPFRCPTTSPTKRWWRCSSRASRPTCC